MQKHAHSTCARDGSLPTPRKKRSSPPSNGRTHSFDLTSRHTGQIADIGQDRPVSGKAQASVSVNCIRSHGLTSKHAIHKRKVGDTHTPSHGSLQDKKAPLLSYHPSMEADRQPSTHVIGQVAGGAGVQPLFFSFEANLQV